MVERIALESIVVGVSDGEVSDEAVRAGLDLGRRFGASIELVHAVAVPYPIWTSVDSSFPAASNAEALTAAWKHQTGRLGRLLGDRLGERTIEDVLRVLPGPTAKVLLARASQLKADLIVLGPHSRRSLFDFGSTARGVLAMAPCDVWVQPVPFGPIRRLLVPIDLSAESAHVLAKARWLAASLGAAVRTLHCWSTPALAASQGLGLGYPLAGPSCSFDDARDATQAEFEQTVAAFDWGDVPNEAVFLEGEPTRSILEEQGSADLIVMGTHGRTGLGAAVLGNVAYGVLKSAELPVLAIRHPHRGRGA